ncbi:MAG: M48 family peptidase [Betaproteobacteria bacterium]|nr:M48 family peptidase [Betaproteobacteria bacterium]
MGCASLHLLQSWGLRPPLCAPMVLSCRPAPGWLILYLPNNSSDKQPFNTSECARMLNRSVHLRLKATRSFCVCKTSPSGSCPTPPATDDEIAFVMGHEIAHALREHGRERQSKAMIAQGLSIGASILSQVMGYGDIGGQVARGVSNVTMLKFSRDDESEADLLGMDLSARAGYDPSAGISLWEKMSGPTPDGQADNPDANPRHWQRLRHGYSTRCTSPDRAPWPGKHQPAPAR